jgi:hypothetical protein
LREREGPVALGLDDHGIDLGILEILRRDVRDRLVPEADGDAPNELADVGLRLEDQDASHAAYDSKRELPKGLVRV